LTALVSLIRKRAKRARVVARGPPRSVAAQKALARDDKLTDFLSRFRLADLVLPAPNALLGGRQVMYKPSMRKWMRERMQRRKKKPEESSTEATQAPLQPAYFDAAAPAETPNIHEADTAESPAPPSRARTRAHQPEKEKEAAAEAVEQSALSQATEASGSAEPARRPQRRRGRGGRGRTREVRPVTEVDGNRAPNTQPNVQAKAPAVAPHAAVKPAGVPAHPKGTVVLAIGLPGSGKSSWFKRNNITPLSSDMLRALLFDDPTEQRFQDLVFSNLRSMLKARLIARRPMNYVDTTNLTPQERDNWIKLAHDYGYDVQAVYFDVPLDVCLERNSKRPRTVPEEAMRRMAGKLKAPEFDEGFSKITVVRVKKKE